MNRPPKYGRLEQVRSVVSVPPSVLIDETDFAAAFADYAAADARIETVLAEIAVTSGASVQGHILELDKIVTALQWRPDALERVFEKLERTIPDWRARPLAVRSAAPNEDQHNRSSAGLYGSVLHVNGETSCLASLLEVWASYFALPAILERLSAGDLRDGRRMCAMIQPMIDAQAAGVVFTVDPITGGAPMVMEYVDGVGDSLVSGRASGRRLHEDEIGSDDPAFAAAVFDAASLLRATTGDELDVEWAWDGRRLQILQLRPITTVRHADQIGHGPIRDIVDLFLASPEAIAALGPTPEFVSYFRQKRGPLRRLAASLGIAAPTALALRVNRSGVATCADMSLADLFQSDRVVLDVNDRARQIIVERADLDHSLSALLSADDRVCVVALRDFVSGRVGLITRRTAEGVLVEWSADGLLALNRGTADSHLSILRDGAGRPEWLSAEEADLILAASSRCAEVLGRVQLEWVHDGGRLLLLDYSSLSDGKDEVMGRDDVLSTGFAHAPMLRVSPSATLIALSEGPSISISSVPDAHELGGFATSLLDRVARSSVPPILVCPRPYAALAVLIPKVAGFVFEKGSLLSHLAILIREAGKPAVCLQKDFDRLSDGCWATLSTGGDPTDAPRLTISAEAA